MPKASNNLVCFSHLRWNFVYQRPQHLITRLSEHFNTFYIEEPIFDAGDYPFHSFTEISSTLYVMVPHLNPNLSTKQHADQLKSMLKNIIKVDNGEEFVFWYYTPMALEFTDSFSPALIVYDCMDELSAFKFAPASLKSNEKKLMDRADLVFTGGNTLYEEKKKYHSAIYPFPSSIDKNHFNRARSLTESPEDQAAIKGIKVGFFGVIDERFDIELVKLMAELRPEWQFILIGPIVKIDPNSLPKLSNIHYLGQRTYQELPAYLSGWDIALIPFLLNESTKYISPTKTPEYLAAGIPVLSTAITDVIKPYGVAHLVHICNTAGEFISAAETELNRGDKDKWLNRVDDFLKNMSWDNTKNEMLSYMNEQLEKSVIYNQLSDV
ncbi:glycosyltransferase involved in cell wall biosynthesis [Pedobacter sp. UYEF25]